MIKYVMPTEWVKYDQSAVLAYLTEAKAAVLSLTTIPYQKSWAEKLQNIQLKREVAGTSRIEGADFTEGELDAALKDSPEELFTRSQRQARAAKNTYLWIANLPDDYPINADLILETHRRIVTGADDDHCPPGQIRKKDNNVNFGFPRHRGAEGGRECEKVFARLDQVVQHELKEHDPLIQALALHYHFASIHPFLDGNGRTARALEALFLQRAGLRDTLFIAMSNYYYDEKSGYLASLSAARASQHDLTPFLIFGLKGIALQCNRLFREIRTHVCKAMFRNIMYDLFNRLATTRKRVIAERQVELLKVLLELDEIELNELYGKTVRVYQKLSNVQKAFFRDLNNLIEMGAIFARKNGTDRWLIAPNLDWPTQITESEFFKIVSQMPKAKTHSFLS